MGSAYFTLAWTYREVLYSAKATGGRKDYNNAISHVEQWLDVRIVLGVNWTLTFEERSH